MKKDKWVWMPHAGHLIVSNSCRFHLFTYVGKYVVSTVGEYESPRSKEGEFETIGINRLYETMVFKAHKSNNKCCPYEASDYSEIDFDGYNKPEDAYKGHLKMCKKWSIK